MVSSEVLQARPQLDSRFLDALAEFGRTEFAEHQHIRKDWSYHDTLTREVMAELGAMPPVEVDKEVSSIYLGNLVVEKGHAEYDRVTAEVFEQHPVFRAWKNTWVAEEEPHGDAMLQWAKVRGLLDMRTVHANVQGYLKKGLSLTFGDAAFGFAYPALQEVATRITHKEVKERLPAAEHVGRRLLSKIIGDEERHERFYAAMVRHALHEGDRETASHQMRGLARAVLGFAMPGIEGDIPDGAVITDAYQRTGAFSIGKVAREVLLPMLDGTGLHGWDIPSVEALDDTARQAQDRLVQFTTDVRTNQDNNRRLVLTLGKARREVAQAA